MRVHFEVSFEPIFTSVSTSEVTAVLARELGLPTVYFDNLTTILDTLHIEVCIIHKCKLDALFITVSDSSLFLYTNSTLLSYMNKSSALLSSFFRKIQ